MRKKVLKGIFASLAVAAVCVPLAACGDSGESGAETATTTAVAGAETESGNATDSTAAGTTTVSTEETGSSGSGAATTAGTEEAGTSESSKTETTDQAASTESAGNEVSDLTPLENVSAESDSLRIDLKGYKVYPAGVGGAANSLKPVVVFYFDATNKGDKETDALSAWTEIFDAYQNAGTDDRNLLGQGVFVDESIASENGTTPMKKGETKSYYRSYEITDDTTSVTLRSHDGLGGAKLGEDIIVRVMS